MRTKSKRTENTGESSYWIPPLFSRNSENRRIAVAGGDTDIRIMGIEAVACAGDLKCP